MIIRLIFCFLIVIPGSLYSQVNEAFIYRAMDQSLLNLWLAEESTPMIINQDLAEITEQWSNVRRSMYLQEIEHFDVLGFIDDQDKRVSQIGKLVENRNYQKARQEAFIMLSDFREIRECFTNDEYALDVLLRGYEAYSAVHKIIHDEMMGLYEWTEFVWHVDQLKCRVEELDNALIVLDAPASGNAISTSLDRLKVCLNNLDESLGDAYRPDFEIPCNDLKLAFMDLFKAFSKTLAM